MHNQLLQFIPLPFLFVACFNVPSLVQMGASLRLRMTRSWGRGRKGAFLFLVLCFFYLQTFSVVVLKHILFLPFLKAARVTCNLCSHNGSDEDIHQLEANKVTSIVSLVARGTKCPCLSTLD